MAQLRRKFRNPINPMEEYELCLGRNTQVDDGILHISIPVFEAGNLRRWIRLDKSELLRLIKDYEDGKHGDD